MKILMIAPEPFFRLRGTPFSIRQRLEALCEFGYRVDLLTYPFGAEVNLRGLRIFRSFRPFWIKNVKIGPSWGKIPLDFFLFLKAIFFVCRKGYDCVHTHEEAGFLGAGIKKIFGIPHVYDMHSSLPEQLVNYKFIHSPVLLKLAQIAEGWLLRNSSAIIAICPYLADWARKNADKDKIFLIENLALLHDEVKAANEGIELLNKLKSEGSEIVLYTGTFEYNQGLDLLIEAASLVIKSRPGVKFVLVGGIEEKINKFRRFAEKLGLNNAVLFTGKRPPEEMAAFMAGSDILVSPRRIGNNTPLKIYSYLFSGKPIVATDISSHTQVLNRQVSVLTEISAAGIAGGILKLLENKDLGGKLAEAAEEYAGRRFSREQYLSRVKRLYQLVASKTK
ncbi:MAG: glycosyltransferase family 4 protein [Candidatus Ratteibacteria bacterium]|nr:glycosyltransferase family 4 protein [Candidatus Ratteibacteria bacterium]